MQDVLTIGEVVEVVRRLDGRRGLAVSARQLRYWDAALSFGAGRATDSQNAARTFTASDVAIARLVRRLQKDGVSARAIWALLLVSGRELRASCRPGTSRVLWVEPNGRAHLLTGHEALSKPARECYALADVVSGVREAVRTLRSGDYEVWNGAKAVRVQELVAV
jgi:DNA-binding transcriptional MerR regulator